ncbi:Peptidase family M50 [Pseudobythopirellula maris]|uniref:Peptidase family M50 n=1 Tax=Pseudobythopirellula maris TaxID=2527991 RepID=A0A5C5ZMS4_9BACT|nr:site-2 protease family protein [Pseudobythopirellula maris]TWT88161.1 Peptidase family M50 [Pseudobythopirellula maris]
MSDPTQPPPSGPLPDPPEREMPGASPLPGAPPQDAARQAYADANGPRELRSSDLRTPAVRRKVRLPVLLFLATAFSTFWVGSADWKPLEHMQSWGQILSTSLGNWEQGLAYMAAVLAILLTHEMGHFVLTLRHGIPASYPLCIPVPFNPIGTMGAVIGMDGLRANRKEIFDIGVAGPLAGLVVAIPVLWLGVRQLDLSGAPQPGEVQLYNPVIVRWMIEWLHPEWIAQSQWIGISQVNPLFMAGWVGMLVTGLNMLPISQLDGGHTIYGLFGRDAHTIARSFVVVAIVYVVINLEQAAMWTPMLILVILMGIHHPPTRDDEIELDGVRWTIGIASLAIPILCFPLLGLKQ